MKKDNYIITAIIVLFLFSVWTISIIDTEIDGLNKTVDYLLATNAVQNDRIANLEQYQREQDERMSDIEHEQLAEWLRDYKKLLEDQKQTGEWVVVGRAAYGYVDIECPCCKYLRQDMQADNKPNFCENCGAYMKGGAE